MWPLLRRTLEPPPAPRRRRPLVAWSTAVAAVAAVLSLAAWSAALNSRLSHQAESQRYLSNALTTFADPTSTKVRLDSATEPVPMEAAYSFTWDFLSGVSTSGRK